MTDINFTSDDLIQTRFVISPMSIASLSANVAFNARHYPLFARWSQYVAETLEDVELPVLRDFHIGTVCIPEFLGPLPVQVSRSFDEELQIVATMAEDHIQEEIDWLTRHKPHEPSLARYQKKPKALRETLVDELSLYWQRVIQPHWRQMRSILDTDIMRQSQLLTTEGHARLFSQWSPQVEFHQGQVRIHTNSLDLTVEMGGNGMMLEPNIFASRMRVGVSHISAGVTLSYPARGAGNWYAETAITPSEALSNLIGDHRAKLLYYLAEPITTTELATALYLTPGAVSQQLGQLHEIGLVDKHRLGRRVYYRLTQRGESLLHVFETGD